MGVKRFDEEIFGAQLPTSGLVLARWNQIRSQQAACSACATVPTSMLNRPISRSTTGRDMATVSLMPLRTWMGDEILGGRSGKCPQTQLR